MESPISNLLPYKETIPYTKANGTAARLEVPFVEIPAGTLLFRGIQLPNPKRDEDPRLFVRDWLGYPKGDRFCMTPTHNTFFYTNPFVPFGAHTVGEWFNGILVCQTVRNLRLVNMISPSEWTRGGKELKALDGTAPIQRCDKFDYSCIDNESSLEFKREKELKAWDNCIHPDFAAAKKVSGWVAIADYDSLDNFKEGLHGKETTMGKYIMDLEQRLPGQGIELLTSTYSDKSKHRGFPEVVLFPWSPHPGKENQYTEARTEEDAADAIAEMSGQFNYLPIACITERGILEAFSGDFKAADLPAYATSAMPGPVTRRAIDKLQADYMEKLMTTGITIPGLGKGFATYDARTGFYVVNALKAEVIDTILNEVTEYDNLCLPLNTKEERERVLEYKIKYRTFHQNKFMKPDTYIDGTVVPARFFIFERPDELYSQFKELNLKLPSKFIPYIWSATEVFQKNLAERKLKDDPRGAEEAERRAGQAKEKIQESLAFIAKKKAERDAAAEERGRGTGRGRGSQRGGPAGRGGPSQRGGPAGRGASARGRTVSRARGGKRYATTRKQWKQQKDYEEALTLAEYRGGGIEPSIEEYVQSTMTKMWQRFVEKGL
jgi:hypothetical protein